RHCRYSSHGSPQRARQDALLDRARRRILAHAARLPARPGAESAAARARTVTDAFHARAAGRRAQAPGHQRLPHANGSHGILPVVIRAHEQAVFARSDARQLSADPAGTGRLQRAALDTAAANPTGAVVATGPASDPEIPPAAPASDPPRPAAANAADPTRTIA